MWVYLARYRRHILADRGTIVWMHGYGLCTRKTNALTV